MDSLLPEFLSIEELQSRLRQFIESDRLSNDKTELVALAHRYFVPAPQRRFRPNRLGTLLTQSQEQFRSQKRTRSPSTDSQKTSSEKHETDRGIYTVHQQKSATKTTPPIKLKRPSVINESSDSVKRLKTEETTPS